MNRDDFWCMRRGKQLAVLSSEDEHLLSPINLRNGKRHKALLLLHGFSSSPAVYRLLLKHLKHYDALVAPVLPGHAENLAAFANMKAADLFSYVENTCSQLINEFERVDVLGLSMGGLLACHLGMRFKLNHLYLLAPALDLHLNLEQSIKLAQGLQWLGFRQFRSAAGNLYTSSACEIAYRQLPLPAIIEILTIIKHFKLGPLSCPVDLFLGVHDAVVDSQKVAQQFANQPDVTLHWLENSAHVLPLDGDLDLIINTMTKE
ncbi:alpha/beta hydrolase [Legionella dresdenensis]|uniref:Alpha/beta hydrolase n=1 Tax=Legionella dresdenensis TaxID=450200 RepID=A0ABV8CI24_9GAMM